MDLPLLYRHKPVFGLDIGRSTIKVAQLKPGRHGMEVLGYGFSRFDKSAATDGVITKPAVVAQALKELFKHSLIGKITTKRAVASLPIAHIYTRILQLPPLAPKDLAEAVHLEAEQYVPLAADDIYVEHQIISPQAISGKDEASKLNSVLMVATPKKVVSSYQTLFDQLGLEVHAIEPNMFANLRAINYNCPSRGPRIIIDFGAQSSDLAIYEQTPRLISTVTTGGEKISELIAQTLKLSNEQASQLKIRYGIAKSRWQNQLATSLQPILSDFANEVQKMMRYYHEHSAGQQSISQIVLVGGGANMPGLADFLSHLSGIEVIICNPWAKLQVRPLQPPANSETTLYATAIGLALSAGEDS